MALSLEAEHEPAWTLPRQFSNGTVISKSENRMGTVSELYKCLAGTVDIVPLLNATSNW